MSLFSRLYDVIRSNINTTRSGKDSYKYDPADLDNDLFDDTDRATDDLPPGADPKLAKYYANLEVPYGSDLATVKKSWKRLARKYHPDMHHGDPKMQKIANELLQNINSAYDELEKHLENKL